MTHNTSPNSSDPVMSRRTGPLLTVAALGFLVFYLATDVVASNLATDPLPMPDAPAAETQAWFTENQTAAVVSGVLQFLSVSALAVFVSRFAAVASCMGRDGSAGQAKLWGLAAAGLMMLSSGFGWLLTAVSPDASLDTVSALRTAGFVTGGTAHVLALGLFVFLASRVPWMSRPVRVFGYVAAVPAVLSLVSLVWSQGAAFILFGRLLCMVWVISAAVSVTRRIARGNDVARPSSGSHGHP